MRRKTLSVSLSYAPASAPAHDAFGDLGPFSTTLHHPMADSVQGALVIAGTDR
jgi:hypothetical protein